MEWTLEGNDALAQSLPLFLRTKPGCPQNCSVSAYNFASRLYLFVIFAFVYPIFLSQTAIQFLLFLLFQSMKSLCIMLKFTVS